MATAVDTMVPPGLLRDELNAGLRRSFRLPVERATICIDEGRYAGVDVIVDRAAGPLVREQLVGLLGPGPEANDVTAGRELFDLLETRVILGWNVADHKGKRIPTTARGFSLVPPDLIATVVGLYLAATG